MKEDIRFDNPYIEADKPISHVGIEIIWELGSTPQQIFSTLIWLTGSKRRTIKVMRYIDRNFEGARYKKLKDISEALDIMFARTGIGEARYNDRGAPFSSFIKENGENKYVYNRLMESRTGGDFEGFISPNNTSWTPNFSGYVKKAILELMTSEMDKDTLRKLDEPSIVKGMLLGIIGGHTDRIQREFTMDEWRRIWENIEKLVFERNEMDDSRPISKLDPHFYRVFDEKKLKKILAMIDNGIGKKISDYHIWNCATQLTNLVANGINKKRNRASWLGVAAVYYTIDKLVEIYNDNDEKAKMIGKNEFLRLFDIQSKKQTFFNRLKDIKKILRNDVITWDLDYIPKMFHKWYLFLKNNVIP